MGRNQYHVDRRIAKAIILAQVGSDAGKGIWDPNLMVSGANRAAREGYTAKDRRIREAISLIVKSGGKSEFNFYVVPDLTTLYLVYFKTKSGGKTIQVSFHSFDPSLCRYTGRDTFKHAQRWDHKVSREACGVIKEAYNL